MIGIQNPDSHDQRGTWKATPFTVRRHGSETVVNLFHLLSNTKWTYCVESTFMEHIHDISKETLTLYELENNDRILVWQLMVMLFHLD